MSLAQAPQVLLAPGGEPSSSSQRSPWRGTCLEPLLGSLFGLFADEWGERSGGATGSRPQRGHREPRFRTLAGQTHSCVRLRSRPATAAQGSCSLQGFLADGLRTTSAGRRGGPGRLHDRPTGDPASPAAFPMACRTSADTAPSPLICEEPHYSSLQHGPHVNAAGRRRHGPSWRMPPAAEANVVHLPVPT